MFFYKVEYLEHGGAVPEAVKHDKGLVSAITYDMAANMVATYYTDIIHLELEQWEDVLTEDDIKEDFNV